MTHRKIDRIGDETGGIGVMMERKGLFSFSPDNVDLRAQENIGKHDFTVEMFHLPAGIIAISADVNAGIRAEMKIPEHMAGGQRGDQQVFWIMQA